MIRLSFRPVPMAALAAVVFTFAGPAVAHHGWSSYDAAKVIKTEGPVEVVRYQNPHGEIEITYEGKRWLVILAPPSRMTNRGLTPDMIKVGSNVSVEGYQHKTDPGEMRAERITVDGKTVELR